MKYITKINGIDCLILEGREKEVENVKLSIKEEKKYPHRYYLRHGELDWSEPCSIERFVLVNFFGIAYASKPLLSKEQDWVDVETFMTYLKEEVWK